MTRATGSSALVNLGEKDLLDFRVQGIKNYRVKN